MIILAALTAAICIVESGMVFNSPGDAGQPIWVRGTVPESCKAGDTLLIRVENKTNFATGQKLPAFLVEEVAALCDLTQQVVIYESRASRERFEYEYPTATCVFTGTRKTIPGAERFN